MKSHLSGHSGAAHVARSSSTPPVKKQLLSVIIAGGTGSTGRELVSKLVAHPRVGRVVVLSRYAIPVNRWSTFFPNLRTADALRYLSIVDVNWSRLYEDTRQVPLTMLSGQERFVDPSSAGATSDTADSGAVGATSSWSDLEGNPIADEDQGGADDLMPTSMLNRSRHLRSRRFEKPRGDAKSSSTTPQEEEQPVQAVASSGGPQVSVVTTSTSARRLARRKLQTLMRSSYYRSVFAGHHVAINCLGSHSFLNPWGVAAVDHDFAITFAKLVRIFNCYLEDAEAEAAEEEADALREAAALADDGVAWKEICAAYLGKDGIALSSDETDQTLVLDNFLQLLAERRKADQQAQERMFGPNVNKPPKVAKKPTLRHFTQVSSAGASALSPLPYFRAHGYCDEETSLLFAHQRVNHAPVHGHADDGSDAAAAAAGGGGGDNQPPPSGGGVSAAAQPPPPPKAAPVSEGCAPAVPPVRSGSFVNHASLTIYKPGLLKRPNARWWERLLQWVAPPVSVESLSTMIIKDILASVPEEAGEGATNNVPQVPQLHVVGAKEIHVRALKDQW